MYLYVFENYLYLVVFICILFVDGDEYLFVIFGFLVNCMWLVVWLVFNMLIKLVVIVIDWCRL